MIIVDTDVISELMRPVPEPDVVSWIGAQEAIAAFRGRVIPFDESAEPVAGLRIASTHR